MRTRIAPSPTGEFQLGNFRTALYNYALAKNTSGAFVVRVEDTDRNRYVEGSMERTLEVLEKYGIPGDESPLVGGPYEPYIQSQRLELYKEYAKKLLDSGHAYYCFCSKERLEELRDGQRKSGMAATRYDKKCLSLSSEEVQKKLDQGEPYVIRLNVPKDELIKVDDLVYGEITFDSNQIDDQVLIKGDGFPTYHFAVVVDDYIMNITHILRGNDWIPSTPKHILLYRFFGWEDRTPKFIHLPLLKELGSSKKLSKRFGAVAAMDFLKQGYLREAVLNFVMFLGWNPGTEKEIYSLDEFIKDFTIEKIGKTDLVVMDREKLLWYNGHYIRSLSVEDLMLRLAAWAQEHEIELPQADKKYHLEVLSLVHERMKTLSEFVPLTHYFYADPKVDPSLIVSFGGDESARIIKDLLSLYKAVDPKKWTSADLDELSHSYVTNGGYKTKQVFMSLRAAVTSETATPPIFDTLELLGKETTLRRLDSALARL